MIPRVLQPEHLLKAYAHGAFPMADEDGRLAWFAPDPRTLIPLDAYHVPRRLERTLKQGRFRITLNRDFAAVMTACGRRDEGTWISPEMFDAYNLLHQLGFAHSLEVWEGDELAGGIYGVSLGGAFYGESMFHRVRDASKVALISLIRHLVARGYELFDVQFTTDHLRQFGAVEVARTEFERRLHRALSRDITFID